MDIVDLLKQPESKTLEFKRDLSSSIKVLRTLVAFANSAGGTLIVGVEDKTKHIIGIKNPLSLEEKLTNLIDDLVTPQLLPEIEVIFWRNSYLLAIQVFPSSTKPHYLKKHGIEKGTYIRIGSTNRLADKTIISELQRVKLEDSYDKQPVVDLNSEAIDFRVTSELFASIRKLKKADLESMDLLTIYQRKKVPTVAAMILFGQDRLDYFPDAWIQVGRFAGTTKTTIIDSQEITSYPISAIDEVLLFIKKHYMQAIEVKGIRHAKKWNVPLTAIREAIINAIVHADYAQQGSPIRLAIFDDRIEIDNPGLLLPGLTIDDIKSGISKLRNRVIGQIFYRLGLIERWGSGVKRIIETCQQAGFAEPLFEEIGTHFRVTIFTEIVSKPSLNESEQMIINVLKKSDGLSTKAIAEKIGKSQRAVRTRLIALIDKGLVIEISKGIHDPGRKYYFNEDV